MRRTDQPVLACVRASDQKPVRVSALSDGTPALGWVAKDTTTDRDVIRSLRQRAFYDPLTGRFHGKAHHAPDTCS